MATTEFKFSHMFQLGKDETEYYLLTKDHVSVGEFEGKPILKVAPEGLTAMARAAFRDVSFMLRRSHNEQVARILHDPEASENDKYVALQFLRNAEVAVRGVLPLCQDTGTAIIHGEKGQQVWTGYCDEEALSLGVFKTYTEENLRYSQNAPLSMYEEVNTRCNLPAQIDIEATQGMEYKFLCVTKGGGSANKTYLYQETKAILNPATLVPFLVEKMKTLGTAACPPYHIAFVIGGTSAEKNLLTVKLASTHYYDNLPTTGDETGRAFRDIELEKEVLRQAHNVGLGAQFGGKYLAHDIRIVRLPRHGASCPVGMGVSCSADRNIKCKINRDGIWIERLDSNPGELIPSTNLWRTFSLNCQNIPYRHACRSTEPSSLLATLLTHASKNASTAAKSSPTISRTILSTMPVRQRHRKACLAALWDRPRQAVWTHTSTSSKATAARWLCSQKATARSKSLTLAIVTADSISVA